MVWKVLFWLQLVIFGIFWVIGYLHLSQTGYQSVTEIGYLSNCVWGLIYFLFMFSLYSLGWKKQYIKKTGSILLLIISSGFFIFSFGKVLWSSYLNIVSSDPIISSSLENQIIFGIIVGIISIIFGVLFIFFTHGISFAGIIGNIVKSNTLAPVSKPYWKIYTVYEIYSLIIMFTHIMFNIKSISQFNFADVGAIICVIYCAIALVGYSWSKRIFSQKFWQISMPIYIVLFIYIRNVSHSQTYLDIMGFSQIMNLISFKIIYCILTLFMFFAVLKYAYTNEVYKKEDVCVEEKE